MTAVILNHPTRFDGDARIRLANMRLMNAMAAVQRNLESFVSERDWDGEMNKLFNQACEIEDRSIALLNEHREPPKAG